MRLLRPPSVRSKLVALTLLTSSVALLLAAAVYTVYQLASLRHELVQDVALLAEVVAAQGRVALDRNDPRALQEALAALRGDEAIVAARVFASDGRSLAGYGVPATRAVFQDGFRAPAQVFHGQHLVMTRPIVASGRSIGTVLVETDLGRVYRRLTQHGLVGGAVMLASFALALVVSLRMRRQIVEPIDRIAASAREASAARLWDPDPGAARGPGAAREDELDRLTRDFQSMLDSLRRRDAALQASERRYRVLVEHAADAVLVFDDEGRIVDVNRQACAELGYSREELLRRRVTDLDAADHGAPLPERWRCLGATAPRTVAITHRRKDRSTYPAEMRLARIEHDGAGLVLALSRNMSERERAARELEMARAAAESADQAKSRFLANINHEIRTPMTSVVAMAELLERSPLDHQQRRYVEIVRSSADSLLGVIDDILELSWIRSGRLSLDSLAFDLVPLVDDVVDLFAQRASSKGLELTSLVCAGVPATVRGDPRHLRQVLVNLVGNAVKFTEHGEVEVTVQALHLGERQVELRFLVRDTGIGVPGELRGALFEPFEQQDSSPTRRHGGAGIGLTISRALVQLMGGSIGVDSSPGGGASFWFTATFDRSPGETWGEPLAELVGLRALVVDANASARRTLRVQLQQLGLEVDEEAVASRAVDALARAADAGRPYGLLLAGVPAAGGVDAGAAVRELAQRADWVEDTHLVLLAPLGEDPGPLPPRGVHGRLTKPIRQGALAAFVLDLLRGEPPLPPPPPGDDAGGGAPPRVLVVDDDHAIRASLCLVLDVLGCRSRAAADGRQALEILGDEDFDVVLMDCQMPLMDGCQATRELRAREGSGRRVPVIGMSGYLLEGERERCLQAGMDEHLSKPLTIAVLESVLATWAGHRVPC